MKITRKSVAKGIPFSNVKSFKPYMAFSSLLNTVVLFVRVSPDGDTTVVFAPELLKIDSWQGDDENSFGLRDIEEVKIDEIIVTPID